jgi:hypothetical protein
MQRCALIFYLATNNVSPNVFFCIPQYFFAIFFYLATSKIISIITSCI